MSTLRGVLTLQQQLDSEEIQTLAAKPFWTQANKYLGHRQDPPLELTILAGLETRKGPRWKPLPLQTSFMGHLEQGSVSAR